MDESTIRGLKLLELNCSAEMKLLESNCSEAIPESCIFQPKEDKIHTPKVENRHMTVTGYDTWLPKDVVKSSLIQHFSSCGEIIHAIVPGDSQTGGLSNIALVFIRGEGAVDKAQKLNGRCECDAEGCKIVVDKVMPRDDDPIIEPLNCGGLNLPACFTPPPKAKE